MKPFISTKEQRLIWRLLNLWEECKATRLFPRFEDMNSLRVGALWPHCFVLDAAASNGAPYFLYLGPEVAKFAGIFLSGPDDWSSTLLDKAVENYQGAIDAGKPVLSEEYLSIFDRTRILYRSVLLPLSDDGAKVNYILGAANGTR